MRFLLRRVAGSVLQIWAASVLMFALFRVAPGDFYSAESFAPGANGAELERLRVEKGLRDSWPRQYWTWVESCGRGEFGTSLAYGMPVGRLLGESAGKTLVVAGCGFLGAWVVGLGLAFVGRRLQPWAAAAMLVPEVIGVGLLLWAAVRMGAPITGAGLPVIGIMLALVPVVYLHAAGCLGEARELLFVKMARQRGIAGARLWGWYILPAAANPLVSLLGVTVASTVGTSLVVEALTGWPGLGPLFLEAVQARDYAVVQAVLVILAVVLAGANLAADLVLYRLDPRIRAGR